MNYNKVNKFIKQNNHPTAYLYQKKAEKGMFSPLLRM